MVTTAAAATPAAAKPTEEKKPRAPRAKKDKQDIRSTVCSLKGSLAESTDDCVTWTAEAKGKFLKAVDLMVINVSRMQRRASLLMLLHVMRCCKEDVKPMIEVWTDSHWRQLVLLGVPRRVRSTSDDGSTTAAAAEQDSDDEDDVPEDEEQEEQVTTADGEQTLQEKRLAATALVLETWERFGKLFPADHLQRVKGDAQTITFAAQQLRDAFKNNCWVPLQARLKRMCRVWTEREIAAGHFKRHALSPLSLFRAIEDGDESWLRLGGRNAAPTVQPYPGACEFVADVRERLGLDEGKVKAKLDKFKVKKRWAAMLEFNWWLHNWLITNDSDSDDKAGNKAAGIALSPVMRVGRKMAMLDVAALYAVITAVYPGVKSKKPQPSRADKWDKLKDLFTPPRRPNWEWTGSLRTDGVRASFCMTPSSGKPAALRFAELTAAAKEKGRKKAERDLDSAEAAQLLKVIRAERKEWLVLGADPGRRNPVYLAGRLPDGELFRAGITRKEYYARSGITKATNRTARWYAPLQAELTKLGGGDDRGLVKQDRSADSGPAKRRHLEDLVEYIERCNELEDRWWELACQRKMAKQAFRVFGGKKRALDRFFNGVARRLKDLGVAPQKVAVAYGAATFNSSGKGAPSSPTTAVYKACTRCFATIKQVETRSSCQCCNDDHEDVHVCWKTADGAYHHGLKAPWTPKKREEGAEAKNDVTRLWGMLFCPSCSMYHNRDKLGALNIAHLFTTTQLDQLPWPDKFAVRRPAKAKKPGKKRQPAG
jgi:hypothetical protein